MRSQASRSCHMSTGTAVSIIYRNSTWGKWACVCSWFVDRPVSSQEEYGQDLNLRPSGYECDRARSLSLRQVSVGDDWRARVRVWPNRSDGS